MFQKKKKGLKWLIKLKFNVTQYSFKKIKIKTSVNDTGGGGGIKTV